MALMAIFNVKFVNKQISFAFKTVKTEERK